MWLALAFVSAALLGFYDTSKKASLKDNAVLPVLLLNTIFSTLIFSPFLIDSIGGFGWFSGTFLDTAAFGRSTQTTEYQEFSTLSCMARKAGQGAKPLSISRLAYTAPLLRAHLLVALKAVIVLSSWICGYFGLKHLPLTIVGPINATRPVLVLVGAMLFFGERLNIYQWTGVLLAILSIFLMSRSSRKEDIDFRSNRWIWCVAAATLLGAVSGLYDKFIMQRLDPVFVQSWYNLYQLGMMSLMCALIWWPNRRTTTPFHWSWAIPLISIFLSLADLAYLYSLNQSEAMISVVSMVRRSSVIISFACGALLFKEKNLKSKALDLLIILVGMLFLYLGSF